MISEDAETVISMYGPKTVTAVFQPVQYNANIIYNKARGSVEGRYVRLQSGGNP